MDIANRIKNLGKYFVEMQVTTSEGEPVIYVVTQFPNGWVIDEEYAKEKAVAVRRDPSTGNYWFFTDMETGEGAIFDVIETNIEKMKEAIERANLLKEKTLELKELFSDESVPITKLRTIKFIMDDVAEETGDEIIIPKKTEKGNKK